MEPVVDLPCSNDRRRRRSIHTVMTTTIKAIASVPAMMAASSVGLNIPKGLDDDGIIDGIVVLESLEASDETEKMLLVLVIVCVTVWVSTCSTIRVRNSVSTNVRGGFSIPETMLFSDKIMLRSAM